MNTQFMCLKSRFCQSIALTAILAFSASAQAQIGEYFAAPGNPEDGIHVVDEILVRYKPGTGKADMENAERGLGTHWKSSGRHGKVRRLAIRKGSSVKQALSQFRRNPKVEYAEPNFIASSTFTPNDSLYRYQWHMDNIRAETAWDTTAGTGTIVAVLDTGVAYESDAEYCQAPDLAGTCFVAGYDFINNDSHPNDDGAHGTHVAGTIAGTTNNSIGVAGLAHEACIMPVKVLNDQGSGSYSAIADGIIWATDNGAKVINMSLGGAGSNATLANAVAYAYNNGVTIVAAAGNDGQDLQFYPASYDDWVISVGATRFDNNLAYYSNTGSSIDLVGPGGDVTVDQNGDGYGDGVLQQTFNADSGDVCTFSYWFYQGTSMATPHVAALAAMVISTGNATTPDEVRCVLEGTTVDLGSSGRDDTFGWGLIDAAEAVAWTCDSDPPSSGPIELFYDSFENGAWDGLWNEDSQNDWFTSSQRDTSGSRSAEVDGSANDAQLVSVPIDLQGRNNAEIDFNWYIERGLDSGEYLAFDVSTNGGSNWTEHARLMGNVDSENTWHSVQVELNDISSLQLRFRAKMSGSREDANVDEVRVRGTGDGGDPPANQAPTATFSESCDDLSCDFTDGSSDPDGTVVSRSWSFGDGDSSSSTHPSHDYDSTNTYTVSLTVTDNDGGTDTTSRDISVTAPPVSNDPPTADFSYSTSDLAVDFTDTSTDDGTISSWSWDFGDGNSSAARNPTHTYSAAGTYTVELTVTDDEGAGDSVTTSVEVNEAPAGPIEVFSDSFENGAWNGKWNEDSQNDWFTSSQRDTSGSSSAEVDGRANDAQLVSVPIDLQGRNNAEITFNWYIENRLDSGEYLAFDVSTNGGSNWTEHARLRGNVDTENTWHPVQIELNGISSLQLRFRAKISGSREDANVDEVVVTAN